MMAKVNEKESEIHFHFRKLQTDNFKEDDLRVAQEYDEGVYKEMDGLCVVGMMAKVNEEESEMTLSF